MIITRRQHYYATTALKASFAPLMGYDIPHDQPKAKAVPQHIVERGRAMGLRFGKLAVTHPAGNA